MGSIRRKSACTLLVPTTTVFVIYGLLMGAGASANKLWQVALSRWLGKQGYRGLAENAFRQHRTEMEILERAGGLLSVVGTVAGRQFLDVGANIGTTTVPALRLHGFGTAIAVPGWDAHRCTIQQTGVCRSRTGVTSSVAAVADETAARLSINADRPFVVYADGDPIGRTPATIEVVPGAIRVLCPR